MTGEIFYEIVGKEILYCYMKKNKAKAISAVLLELNLKKKTGRNGTNKMKREETGRNRINLRKNTKKNQKKKKTE